MSSAGDRGPPSRFRPYRVERKVAESDVIASFHLRPVDGRPLAGFRPGQFLTFRLPAAGRDQPIIRTYSISSGPAERDRYRITVKREPRPAGRPDLPPGLGSGYLHDAVAEGDIVDAAEPRGDFFLDEDSPRPVVLLSGGVGLTPMVSMWHALATSPRDAYFIHACDNGRVHALRDEVLVRGGTRAEMRVHFVYRSPTQDDAAARRFDSAGVITRPLLQGLLPLDDYDFYLCGPPPFMAAVYGMLRSLGVAKPRVRYEFFGPATVLDEALAGSPSKQATAADAADASKPGPAADGPQVLFAKSGRTAAWGGFKGSLLEFAEMQGLAPDFSCRAGICSTCSCRLLKGVVSYIEQPLDPPEAGQALICISRPAGDIEIDL